MGWCRRALTIAGMKVAGLDSHSFCRGCGGALFHGGAGRKAGSAASPQPALRMPDHAVTMAAAAPSRPAPAAAVGLACTGPAFQFRRRRHRRGATSSSAGGGGRGALRAATEDAAPRRAGARGGSLHRERGLRGLTAVARWLYERPLLPAGFLDPLHLAPNVSWAGHMDGSRRTPDHDPGAAHGHSQPANSRRLRVSHGARGALSAGQSASARRAECLAGARGGSRRRRPRRRRG